MNRDEEIFTEKINPSSEELKELFEKVKKIAVIGLSPKEERPSNRVAKYLVEQGYEIVPVNPGQKEILGLECYGSLADIPFNVDVADIFLRSDRVPDVVDQALNKGIGIIWIQLEIFNRQAAQKALDAGATVVMNKCMKQEHERLFKQ